MDIRSDRQKRLSYVELGKKYRIGPRTAKRYAESPQRPKYTLTGPKPTKLDLYGSEQVDENLHLNAVRACLKIEKVLDFCAGRGGFKKKTAEQAAACRGFLTPKSVRFGQKDSIGDFSNRP